MTLQQAINKVVETRVALFLPIMVPLWNPGSIDGKGCTLTFKPDGVLIEPPKNVKS